MYYIQDQAGEFYLGTKPTPGGTVARFGPNPNHAVEFKTIPAARDRAKHLIDANPFRSPLRPLKKEHEYIKGSIFDYFLFETFLMIVLRDDRHEDFQEIYESSDTQDLKWLKLTEDDRANGKVEYIMPGKIGALTDAPIIGFNIEWTEDSEDIQLTENSLIYWYPDYQITNELEHIANRDYVKMDNVEIEINPA